MRLLPLAVLAATLLLLAAVFLSSCNESKDPKVGEIWRYSPTPTGNPFLYSLESQYYDYKVIEIRGNYLKYMDIKYSYISSSSIRRFKIEAKCLSNCR